MEQLVKTKIRPGTVQTIKDQLEFQLTQRPSWFEYHMPEVADRGRVEYGDVEGMTARQAEAVRNLLVDAFLYHQKRLWQERASNLGFASDGRGDPRRSAWLVRARLIEEALEDLCSVFGLANPLI